MAGYISVSLGQVTKSKTFNTGYFSLAGVSDLSTGFVSNGATSKLSGRTLSVATITRNSDGTYNYVANYKAGYLTVTGGTAVVFESDSDYWNSALNVGHSINLSAGVGDAWKVTLGSYDDTVKIASKGNTINTGTAQTQDWVIIEGEGGNSVTFGGAGLLSIAAASSKNTITAAGAIGTAAKYATIAGNSNVITATTGYASVGGNKNSVTFTDSSALGGYITLGANATQDTIKIAASLASVNALGGSQNYISVAGASGYITIADGKKDTIDAVQANVTIGATVQDAVLLGSENSVSLAGVGAGLTITDQGTKDTLIAEAAGISIAAAGTGGLIKSNSGIALSRVTISGSGYTFTGSSAADSVTVSGSSNKINGNANADSINITGSYNTIQDGAGNDNIFLAGSSNNVTLAGDNDNDYVSISGAYNKVLAAYEANAAGSDTVTVSGSSNLIDVSKIADTATMTVQDGGKANTILGGTKGINVLVGPTADEPEVVLAMGNDNLDVEGALGGKFTLGGGDDTVSVNGGTGHTFALGTGADSVLVKATYETIYAGTGDDSILFDGAGTDGFNYVELAEDNNLVSLKGGDGHTTIMGGISADSLVFTNGDVEQDVLQLGAGNDYVQFSGATALNGFGGAAARGNNTSVYGGVGDDSVYAATAEQLMVDGGTGDDSITIVDARYNTIVAGVGDDSITLGAAGAVTTTGYNVVNLGGLEGNKGHNQVSIGGGLTNNIVYGGVEKDIIDLGTSGGRNEVSLTAKNSTVTAAYRDDTITAAKGGVDIIDAVNVAANEEVVVSNYSIADKDVLAGVEDISFVNAAGNRELRQAAFVGDTSVFNSDGTIDTDLLGTINANITPTEGDAGVQAYVRDTVYGATTTAVWFATDYGSNINAAKDHVKVAMVMTGANNDAADTIIGGDLADTIYAGTGDTLAGGLGNDSLVNTTAVGQSREEFGIARYTGKDTVQNFDGGFAGTDDAVLFYEGTLLNGTSVTYTTGQMTINNGSGSLVLQLADTNSVDSISAHVLLQDGMSGSAQRLTAITAGSTETVTDATIAKYYYGSKNGGSAIDVSGLTQGVKIDLGNSGRYFEAGENYSYIDAVTGSNGGDNFLAGNGDRSETLTGGNGVFNTLYGGGSANDQLVGGGTGALGVNATDVFYFGQSDGKDVITNIGEGDKVMLYDMVDDGSVTAEVVSLTGGNFLRVTNANTGAQAFIESSQNDETYDVYFTNGINGDVTSHYQVTGTTMKKV